FLKINIANDPAKHLACKFPDILRLSQRIQANSTRSVEALSVVSHAPMTRPLNILQSTTLP
ncbi:MAG TPA: hypothetical protein VK658_05335, partial [Chryseolinea sp.]|nr:hypothetical protein [Chryseolinea sp.]